MKHPSEEEIAGYWDSLDLEPRWEILQMAHFRRVKWGGSQYLNWVGLRKKERQRIREQILKEWGNARPVLVQSSHVTACPTVRAIVSV